MRTVLACLVVVALGMHTDAEAFRVVGVGTSSCGTWTVHRRALTSPEWFTDSAWVAGFLSGIGFVGEGGDDPLHGLDANAVDAWIDNYCQANPLDDIETAAEHFYRAHPH
jgi:hypothetical protein